MADCRITCITKPDVNSPHEHITHVGNPSVPWKLAREQVIRNIESKVDTFYVLDSRTGERAEVGVRYPNDGRSPFIQTYSDGHYNNNLLSLNQCPII